MSEATAVYSDEIRSIGDQLAGLKKVDAADLLVYLADTYNIVDPNAGQSNTAIEEVVVEEQLVFDLYLKSVDPTKKVNAIKLVRAATGLGLKESKDLVEGAPKLVKEAMQKAEADKLKKELEEGGCVVELK
mgnify:CR=1 FL=1